MNPFTGEPEPTVKPHQRMSAARELMRRAFGESAPSRAAPTSVPLEPTGGQNPIDGFDEHDPLNARLARLVRERTNNGIDAAEMLIRVVENEDEDETWLPSHQLAAARELIHRAYDLNYDAVTWKDLDDYRRAADPYDHGVELQRTRKQSEESSIIREYGEAWESGDEEAMSAAETKFNDYIRRENGDDLGEEPAEYLEYGPADPDPTVDARPPMPDPKQYPGSKNSPAAAQVRVPRLTFPVNTRGP